MDIDAYSPHSILAACAVALVIMSAIVWGFSRRGSLRRTAALRERFGPEYSVMLLEYGSRRKAEDVLEIRLRHVEALTLRPVNDGERRRCLAEWDDIQRRFADHPRGAVTEADELISSVLTARGYTGGRFDHRVAEISVHHARHADPYRRANAIVARAGKNEATLEELRSAMILYRSLLDELLQSKMVIMPRTRAA